MKRRDAEAQRVALKFENGITGFFQITKFVFAHAVASCANDASTQFRNLEKSRNSVPLFLCVSAPLRLVFDGHN